MSAFNTPVLRTINGVDYKFPRLLMPDIEELGKQLVLDRKKRVRDTHIANGYSANELPGLLIRTELEDYHQLTAVIEWSQMFSGARKVILKSWEKGGGAKADIFGKTGFMEEHSPQDILNLAYEVLSPPPPEKEEVKNPPQGENAPASEEA